ncbi:MAG: GNAT family N-acetyltransferase [Ignavibacteriaceae bacterium]|nr:GNAT family N-acetyltransferase [Ignavibacteriaceae bacterium]
MILEKDKTIIRTAEERDVKQILDFIIELAEYEKLLHEVKVNEESLKKNLFGSRPYAEVLIAEYDGQPAGHAIFFHNFSTFVGKPGVYLEDLYVRPQLRGKGIGKLLLLSLVKLAKQRDCGRVEWSVLNWNTPSIEFYKNLEASLLEEWQIFRLTADKFDGLN